MYLYKEILSQTSFIYVLSTLVPFIISLLKFRLDIIYFYDHIRTSYTILLLDLPIYFVIF